MSRDGSGTYSLPSSTLAVSGDPISSTKFNTLVQDLEADANVDRPIAAGGTGASTASAARTNLGLAIGTDVQAFDAGLLSIAGLTTAADRSIYTTASDTYAVYTLTAAGRAILDDADAAAQRTTLGLGTAAVKNTGTSGDAVPLLNVANTFSAQQTVSDGSSRARLNLNGDLETWRSGGTVGYTYLNQAYTRYLGHDNTNYVAGGNIIWHAGNDGAGSTLDADTLDGVQGSNYARLDTANTFAGTVTSDARVAMRRGGNNFEWGHPTAAYVATLGAEAGSGAPFWLLGGEAGTTSNTYRTRGILAAGSRGNNAGGIVWFTLTNSNADNQSPTDRMTLLASGELQLTDVGPTSTLAGGTKAVVRNRQDSSYTLVLADAGKSIVGYGSTASQTWTIPANGSVAYPIGTTITFINMRTVACSVACTTDTMYLAGTGTVGTRTLSSYGWCTAVKTDTTNWIIGGTGLS